MQLISVMTIFAINFRPGIIYLEEMHIAKLEHFRKSVENVHA